jgi:hypothetical protein
MIMTMQTTMTRRPAAKELRRLGIQVTASGDLAELRAKTLLTKNSMARMLGISIGALSAYEDLKRAMTADVALRVGEWYWGAITALQDAIASGVPIQAMIPSAQAAQYLNQTADEVEARCASGELRHESLGVMGIYLYADDLPGLTAKRVARRRAPVTV